MPNELQTFQTLQENIQILEALSKMGADGNQAAKEQGERLGLSLIPEMASGLAEKLLAMSRLFTELGYTTPPKAVGEAILALILATAEVIPPLDAKLKEIDFDQL